MYDSNCRRLLWTALIAAMLACSGGGEAIDDAEDSNETNDLIDAAGEPDEGPQDVEEEIFVPPPPPAEPVVDLESPNLFDMPFPSDLRRTPEGGVDLSGFPNPNQVYLLEQYVGFAEEVLDGFSLTPSILFQFTGPLNTSIMPLPAATKAADSMYQLVNVDPSSPEYAKRHPIKADWWDKKPTIYVPNFTLGLRPVYGIPLRPNTTYAAFVTTKVQDAYFRSLVPSKTVGDGLEGKGPLAEHLTPLRLWMEGDGNLLAADIAVATVFTTGDPTKEMWAVRDFIEQDISAPELTDIVLADSEKPGFELYEGHYPSPNFQTGEKPYEEGGDIRFDDDYKPIIYETENLRFALVIPKNFEMPEKGWPIVLYGHGTGGDWKSFIDAQPHPPAHEFAERGVAVMGIDQPLHGDRFEGELNVEFYSFNFVNGRAGRSNFRQSAIDVMVQIRFARESLKIPAEQSHTTEEIRFDPDNVFFMGHSHGGLSGGIFAPLQTGLKAIILSGAGGGLSHTIILRKNPYDIKHVLEVTMGIPSPYEVTVAHPIVGLIQNLVDATDPLSYAPFYQHPGNDRPPLHIMMTEGTNDKQTPAITTESLAAAANIPIMHPPATDPLAYFLLEMEPIKTPIAGNFNNEFGKGTAFLMQFDKADHWAVFKKSSAVKRYTEFVLSAIENGAPSIK